MRIRTVRSIESLFAQRLLERHGEAHQRAPAGLSLDVESSTHALCALAHGRQPESREFAAVAGSGIKAHAIIRNTDEKLAVTLAHVDAGDSCTGVFTNIG